MKKAGGYSEDSTFGYSGKYVSIMNMIFDTLVLGILWIICSIPIVTIGASSTALYYAFVKTVKHSDGYAVKEFFRSFRRNFKQATAIWLIDMVAIILTVFGLGVFWNSQDSNFVLFMLLLYLLVLLIITAASVYVFSAISRFDMNTMWFIKISLFMVFRYLGSSLLTLVSLFCIGALIYRYNFLIFVLPGPAVFLISEFIEPILKKHEPDQVKQSKGTAE